MAESKAAAASEVKVPTRGPSHGNEGGVPNPYESDPKFENYLASLSELRQDGVDREAALKDEIHDVKNNKLIDDETKEKIIETDKTRLGEARKVAQTNKNQVSELVREALADSRTIGKKYYAAVKAEQTPITVAAKQELAESKIKLKAEHEDRLKAIESEHIQAQEALTAKGNDVQAKLAGLSAEEAKKAKRVFECEVQNEKSEHKAKAKAENIYYKSLIGEVISAQNDKISNTKDLIYGAYLSRYGYEGRIHGNRHTYLENLEYKYRQKRYAFKFSNWILKNALYLIILIFYIYCIIASDGNLIQWNNILGILSQSSTKMFFSLGVAGLILIAGTDLSIGRLTGMAASFGCMFLADITYPYSITHPDGTVSSFTIVNMVNAPVGLKIACGLLFCIFLCVLFSSIAGFFSAKFKMHPFITTLSTQLLIFGLMMVGYADKSNFNANTSITDMIDGDSNYRNLIIFAAVAIVIAWFIWNKTKFGKNMYAVGGNAEAAAVSGISVFWTTFFIFVMAGVFYGVGGFLEACRTSSATPNTGFGTELDAIAACVVGGISFNGGVGTIGGAVLGTIIFTGMTYCLTNLGLNVNVQYIFKGIIIMLAVCLDSLKYLKKK